MATKVESTFMTPLKPTSGLKQPKIGDMNWIVPGMSQEGAQQIGLSNFLTPNQAAGGTAINTDFNTVFNNKPGGGFDLNGHNMSDYQPQPPGAEGAWLKPASFGLNVAQVGLGVYNAMEQSKMNKFMRSYYGDQMDMMKADYTSSAKDANSRLQWQQQERIASQGLDPNSAENQKQIADYMSRWGAQETV